MRFHRFTVLALAAGLVLSQQACTPVEGPSGDPVSFTAPSEGAADPVLSGRHRFVIKPVGGGGSTLALDAQGRLNLTDGETGREVFVLVPTGDKYLVKADETSCLGVRESHTVAAAPCDASLPGQLFTITQRPDQPAYAISNQGAYLQVSARNGVVVAQRGDASYTFVDKGPSGS